MDESKLGNKEGYKRMLILVQVVEKIWDEKIWDEKNGSQAPICPWEQEVTG